VLQKVYDKVTTFASQVQGASVRFYYGLL